MKRRLFPQDECYGPQKRTGYLETLSRSTKQKKLARPTLARLKKAVKIFCLQCTLLGFGESISSNEKVILLCSSLWVLGWRPFSVKVFALSEQYGCKKSRLYHAMWKILPVDVLRPIDFRSRQDSSRLPLPRGVRPYFPSWSKSFKVLQDLFGSKKARESFHLLYFRFVPYIFGYYMKPSVLKNVNFTALQKKDIFHNPQISSRPFFSLKILDKNLRFRPVFASYDFQEVRISSSHHLWMSETMVQNSNRSIDFCIIS